MSEKEEAPPSPSNEDDLIEAIAYYQQELEDRPPLANFDEHLQENDLRLIHQIAANFSSAIPATPEEGETLDDWILIPDDSFPEELLSPPKSLPLSPPRTPQKNRKRKKVHFHEDSPRLKRTKRGLFTPRFEIFETNEDKYRLIISLPFGSETRPYEMRFFDDRGEEVADFSALSSPFTADQTELEFLSICSQ